MLGPEKEEAAGEWSKERIDDLHSDIQSSMTYWKSRGLRDKHKKYDNSPFTRYKITVDWNYIGKIR